MPSTSTGCEDPENMHVCLIVASERARTTGRVCVVVRRAYKEASLGAGEVVRYRGLARAFT